MLQTIFSFCCFLIIKNAGVYYEYVVGELQIKTLGLSKNLPDTVYNKPGNTGFNTLYLKK